MVRGCAVLLICAGSLLAQDPEPSFEVEPDILPQNLKNETAPEKSDAPTPLDIGPLEKALERAKRSAASAERFYKIGALSKVEAETRQLKVVRLEAELQSARLAEAKGQTLADQDATRQTVSPTPKIDSTQHDVDLARAIAAAHSAAAKKEQAELEAAENNLKRQQKLLALGSGHKSAVNKAEQKLTELKQSRTSSP